MITLVQKDSFQGTSDISKTYEVDEKIREVDLFNDGTVDITLVIRGQTMVIKPSEKYEGSFNRFTSLSLTVTEGNYRVLVRGEE